MRSDTIVGYTFRAAQFCPACIIAQLPTGHGGAFDGWTVMPPYLMSSETNLSEIASAFGIYRTNESSFDSEYFPKVIFADQVNDARCDHCDECEAALVEHDRCFEEDDIEDDGLHEINVTALIADHGSIVQFYGTDRFDEEWVVAVDHRPAQDIIEALCDSGEALVHCEGWALSIYRGQTLFHPESMDA